MGSSPSCVFFLKQVALPRHPKLSHRWYPHSVQSPLPLRLARIQISHSNLPTPTTHKSILIPSFWKKSRHSLEALWSSTRLKLTRSHSLASYGKNGLRFGYFCLLILSTPPLCFISSFVGIKDFVGYLCQMCYSTHSWRMFFTSVACRLCSQ
jgi:hypothetical protein